MALKKAVVPRLLKLDSPKHTGSGRDMHVSGFVVIAAYHVMLIFFNIA